MFLFHNNEAIMSYFTVSGCFASSLFIVHPWVYSDIQQNIIKDLFVPGSVLEVNLAPQALIGWWAVLLICACSYYIGEGPL